ncbi:MAG: hypothetical protein Q9195_004671 [Heterodermia aff. obscurata]
MGNLDKSEAIDFPIPDAGSYKESNTTTNGHSGCYEATDPEKLFDSLNQTYSDAYESNAAQVQCIQKLLSMLSPGSRVLDLGSGTGLPVASMLTNAGMNVTGIDISSAMIDVARVNVPSATFHRCNMRQYRPPNNEKYDAIISVFSIINLPTSAIREMAFKMSHWLKSGGLLVLGTIDFTDVKQAEGWPADPYGEWLNHHFMGQVIKDNVFGVGQWISLLRSADIALVDAQGSVFAAEDKGIVIEPECFFIGRKGEKEALMGPFCPSTASTGLSQYMLTEIEQRIIADGDELARLLNGLPDVADNIKGRIRIKNNDIFTTPESEKRHSHTHDVSTPALGTNGDGHTPNTNGASPPPHPCILIHPAPFNDTLTILNSLASSLNHPTFHPLHTAASQLRSAGYTQIQTHLLGDEYLAFASTDDAVDLLLRAFPAAAVVGRELVQAQVERYFANQTHCGGRADRIGFQRVVVVAR